MSKKIISSFKPLRIFQNTISVLLVKDRILNYNHNMEHKEKIKSPLDLFREEIAEWVKGEIIKMAAKAHYDPHAEHINPEHLTEADRLIWEKVKDGSITRQDVETHEVELKKDALNSDPAVNQSRDYFRALVINKGGYFIGKRELEEELREELDRRKQNQ